MNLLDHPLVVDGGCLVVAEQTHLPRQLRVLADVRHGDGHGEHRSALVTVITSTRVSTSTSQHSALSAIN